MTYPNNSTAKIYYDQEGNEVTLRQLIKLEPEWAHSRIKAGEEAEIDKAALQAKLQEAERIIKQSIIDFEASESPFYSGIKGLKSYSEDKQ